MKHFLLILGLVCLGYTSSTANFSTTSFWQTVFPDAFSTKSIHKSEPSSFATCSVPCIDADSMELVKLIQTTNIEVLNTTWNVNNPVCTWIGVTIDFEGYVREIQFTAPNVSGTLPPTFGDGGLTKLNSLLLDNNNLTGTIPSSLGKLTALGTLWLDDNQFTGTLPTELGNITSLVIFWIDNNNLTGAIPQSLLTIPSLSEISIYDNNFDSLPDFTTAASPNIAENDDIFCRNNNFTFDDLVPNASFMNRPGSSLYSPQAPFTIPAAAALQTGDTYAIDLGIDATVSDNVYRWTKDGLPFGPLLSVNQLDLSPIRFEDAGTYCCFVTNPQLPLLELVSTCQTITVTCGTSTEIIDDVLCAGGFITVNGIDYGDPNAGFPSSGTEDVSDLDQYGCDSIVVIDLTIMNGMPVAFEPVVCRDDTVFVNGTPYYFGDDEGTETFMVSGCDSIVEVNLDFFQLATNTIDGTFCRSDTVFVDGVAYYFGNASGTQTLDNDNFRGCDSLVTINLEFHPAYEGNDNRELCAGQSVFINGTEYGESPLPQSGLERITDKAPNGCDSLVTVTITIIDGVTETRDDVLCPGQTIFVNGTEYGESPLDQMGTEIIPLPNGCDSTININISFQNQITDNFVPFFCYDQTIEINGTTYGNPALGHQQSGTETISGTGGCDTLRSIFINIHPQSEADINLVICDGGSIEFNGTDYNAGNTSGTEIFENADPNGCDSIYNVTVTIYTPEEANITPQVCPGDDFELDGTIFNAADPNGTVVLENRGFLGCDSIVNVALSFYDSLKGNFTRTICENDNFIYNGTLYGDGGLDEGMEVLSEAGANSCDSFIQVTVNYFPAPTGNYTIQLCPGESEVFDNTLYGSQDGGVDSGFETLEGEGLGGCDSTVNVTVVYYSDPTPGFFEERICRTDTLFYNGTAYHINNTTGTENIGAEAFNGCDSLVEINLRFFPEVINREDPTLCSGTTIEINGTIYGEAPMYLEYDSIVLENASSRGCDSTIIVDLSFNSFVENNITGEYCGCEEVVIDGQTFDCNNPSDTITFVGGSFTGCDSIVNFNLNFNEAPVFDLTETLCPGETITVRGTVYGESLATGVEIFPAATSAGCDSTVNINLDFYDPETREISATICQGDSILVGDTYYKFAGTFNEVVSMATANNCDSILILTLQVTVPEPVVLDDLGDVCSSANPIALPTVQSGINGNWSGDGVTGNIFDPSVPTTNDITLTFIPEDGCAEPNSTDITISSFSSSTVTDSICPGEMLTISGIDIDMPGSYQDTLVGVTGCDSLVFIEITAKTPVAIALEDIPALCSGDAAITLDTIQDGINGSWSGMGASDGNMFDPDGLSGMIELTFTPSEMGCFMATTTQVTIGTNSPITLASIPTLCADDAAITLDTIQDGINGSWSGMGTSDGNMFDPNGLSGMIELTFTPSEMGCFMATTTQVTISTNSPITLASIPALCPEDAAIMLDTIQDGINGSWSGMGTSDGNMFDPAGLSGMIELTFTPSEMGCFMATTTEVTINDGGPVNLATIPALCSGDAAIMLDTIQDGINGSWSGMGTSDGNMFDPDGLSGMIELTFTPSEIGCFIATTTEITINDGGQIILEDLPSICAISDPMLLDTFQSGTEGNWSGNGVTDNSFDPNLLTGNIELTFTPTNGGCVTANSTFIEITEPTPITIDPLGTFCGTDPITLPIFPGITGTWNGPGVVGNEFDPTLLGTGEFTLSFTPSGDNCLTTNTTTIMIGDFVVEEISQSICEITGETVIINGVTYSTAGIFSDTTSTSGCGSITNITLTDASTLITPDVFPGLCSSGGIFNLPMMQSGITGTWTGDNVVGGNAFDPTDLSGPFMIEFIPEAGACALPATAIIEVGNNASGTITESICQGDSIALGGVYYSVTGTYMETIPNGSVAGCDSITTLNLTVENMAYTLDNFSALCASADPITLPTLQDGINGNWEGTGITINTFDPNGLSGNISITFVPDANTCADIALTIIEVTDNTMTDIEATICDGETYSLNNIDYTAAGTFMQTLPGSGGDCDTLLNLMLTVESIDNLPAANAGNDQEICGDETSLSAITNNGITGFWEAIIGQPMILDSTNPATSLGDLQEDTYQLRWVVSSEFCPDYDQDTVNISVAMDDPLAVMDSFLLTSTNPVIELDLTANDDLPEDFTVTLLNEPITGTIENIGVGLYEYTAAPGFESGEIVLGYQVCSVICPELCSQASVVIDLVRENDLPVVEVPSGITPNGDDKNERLVIPAIRDNPELFDNAELVVFSRWGNIVFQAQPYTNNWDGSGPNGEIVPQGTYYYVLRLNLGEGVVYKGDITVLR